MTLCITLHAVIAAATYAAATAALINNNNACLAGFADEESTRGVV
jgi:hypothetical protein